MTNETNNDRAAEEAAYWDKVHAERDGEDQKEHDSYSDGHNEVGDADWDSDREASGGTTAQERIAASHEANEHDGF